MANEYTGPYALGEPYAKVIPLNKEDKSKEDLVCPECNKQMKSPSGYTLHLQRCCPKHLEKEPYEDRQAHQPKNVWQLDLGVFGESLKAIDPNAYFITSGEAVRKAERLCLDYENALAASRELLEVLKAVKKDAKYLETQWESNRLLLKQKNPRPTSRISQRTIQNEQRAKKPGKLKPKAAKKPKKSRKR